MNRSKSPAIAQNATCYDNHSVLSGITDEFHEPAMIYTDYDFRPHFCTGRPLQYKDVI